LVNKTPALKQGGPFNTIGIENLKANSLIQEPILGHKISSPFRPSLAKNPIALDTFTAELLSKVLLTRVKIPLPLFIRKARLNQLPLLSL
jgi:hypothetical protein